MHLGLLLEGGLLEGVLLLSEKVAGGFTLVANDLLEIARNKGGLAAIDQLKLLQNQLDGGVVGSVVVMQGIDVLGISILFLGPAAVLQRLEVAAELILGDLLELDVLAGCLGELVDQVLGSDLGGTGQGVDLVAVAAKRGGLLAVFDTLGAAVAAAVSGYDVLDGTQDVGGVEGGHLTVILEGERELTLVLDDGGPEHEKLVHDALAEDDVAVLPVGVLDDALNLVERVELAQTLGLGTFDREHETAAYLLLLHGAEDVPAVLGAVLTQLGQEDGAADAVHGLLEVLLIVVVDLNQLDVLHLFEALKLVDPLAHADELDVLALLLELLGKMQGDAAAEPVVNVDDGELGLVVTRTGEDAFHVE